MEVERSRLAALRYLDTVLDTLLAGHKPEEVFDLVL